MIYICWISDYGSDRDDGVPIEDCDPQSAAEEFCRREDMDDPVRSFPVVVTVEGVESRITKWSVDREMVPHYYGSELKP